MFVKRIQYDRVTKDFEVTVNGHLIGYCASYLEAEALANHVVYNLLKRGNISTDSTPEAAS